MAIFGRRIVIFLVVVAAVYLILQFTVIGSTPNCPDTEALPVPPQLKSKMKCPPCRPCPESEFPSSESLLGETDDPIDSAPSPTPLPPPSHNSPLPPPSPQSPARVAELLALVENLFENRIPGGNEPTIGNRRGLVATPSLGKIFAEIRKAYPTSHPPSPLPHELKVAVGDFLFNIQKEMIWKDGWCTKSNPTRDFEYWDQFYNSFPPVVGCELVVRAGIPADGGKYLCNPHSIFWQDSADESPLGPERCIVYSVGTRGEVTFDRDMEYMFGCEVHSFDSSIQNTGEDIGGSHFHPWCLGPTGLDFRSSDDGKGWKLKGQKCITLREMAQRLGHDRIDVLKMDVEGSEDAWLMHVIETDPNLLEDLHVKLMLIEYHAPLWRKEKRTSNCLDREELSDTLQRVHDLGYYMYSQESNLRWIAGIEYGFIHRDYI